MRCSHHPGVFCGGRLIKIPFSCGALVLSACGTLGSPQRQPDLAPDSAAQNGQIVRLVAKEIIDALSTVARTQASDVSAPKPSTSAWLIRVDGVDSATARELRGELLSATRGRDATLTDTMIMKLEIESPTIRNDAAIVSTNQGAVWCSKGVLFRAGAVYEYRLLRLKNGWQINRRDGGTFYDAAPPPASGDPVVGAPCISAVPSGPSIR